MMRERLISCVVTLVWILSSASSLRAGEAMDQIRVVLDRVMQILNDPRLMTKENKKERGQRLREVADPLLDYPEMARRALGRHWDGRTPSEREEFVVLFKNFLQKIYTDQTDHYDGEKFVVSREVVGPGYTDVESKFVNKLREEALVVFRLRQIEGEWKVYDVVVEGISLVNNYHAQFNRVIRNQSYRELIRILKEKTG